MATSSCPPPGPRPASPTVPDCEEAAELEGGQGWQPGRRMGSLSRDEKIVDEMNLPLTVHDIIHRPMEVNTIVYKRKNVHFMPGLLTLCTARDGVVNMLYLLYFCVQEFNDILTRCSVTEETINICRDIRRRGKNKVGRVCQVSVTTFLYEVVLSDSSSELP